MVELFLKILNMSIAASWLILAVAVLRFLLKKAPKWINVLLWGLVALRLAVPFSFESALSLIPSSETVTLRSIQYGTPAIQSGIPAVDQALDPVLEATFALDPFSSVDPLYAVTFIAAEVWLMGIAAMLLYAVISYVRVYRSVAERVPYGGNIFLCDHVKSPFILGLVRPRIYLPSSMEETATAAVIAHEQAHLARRDHWWKPLGFLILAVHWFNPLCWLAYVLLCRDIELACDEKVIRPMDLEEKKRYSTALVECGAQRRLVTICPLAFGEVGVKERVKNVLSYKKPAFWVIVLAIVACAVVTVCFATSPKNRDGDQAHDHTITFPVDDSERTEYNGEVFDIEPFSVQFALPEGWSVGEFDPQAETYLYSGVWSRVGIYDEEQTLVGAVGYNICDEDAALEEPMSVYHQISLGNDYQFSIRDTYHAVNTADWFETATAQVYRSPVLDPAAQSETINYGIVSCCPDQSVISRSNWTAKR